MLNCAFSWVQSKTTALQNGCRVPIPFSGTWRLSLMCNHYRFFIHSVIAFVLPGHTHTRPNRLGTRRCASQHTRRKAKLFGKGYPFPRHRICAVAQLLLVFARRLSRRPRTSMQRSPKTMQTSRSTKIGATWAHWAQMMSRLHVQELSLP